MNRVKEKSLKRGNNDKREFSYEDVLTVNKNIVNKSSDGPDIFYKIININDYSQVWEEEFQKTTSEKKIINSVVK